MWAGEESQDVNISDPGPEDSDAPLSNNALETTTAMSRKETADTTEVATSKNGYKVPDRIPGVLTIGDPIAYRNGTVVLPNEKAFSIQIGWRLFKLSGASLNSDGTIGVSLPLPQY